MKLHLLGVNGPYPASGGATSGYLLQAGETLLQFDLGCAVLPALTARTAPEKLTAVFLTHWHFDHTCDLLPLLYRLQALGTVLPVYAPADEQSAIRGIVAAADCFELHTVQPGDQIRLGALQISVGEARHPVPTVGYRVEEEGFSFGYTGDTNTLASLADFYRGCNLLLADGLFPEAAWAEGKPHLSAALAARLAADAGVKRLVITHLNPAFPPRTLLEEAWPHFAAVTLAEAGTSLDL